MFIPKYGYSTPKAKPKEPHKADQVEALRKEGKSDREIADWMGLSPSTVSKIRKNHYIK
jgi:DNA-binding NarL/FixJ family response regulator